MPAVYTRRQKRHALHVIDELGSVAAAARKLNIPARTLRDWRLEQRRNPVTNGSYRHPVQDYAGSDNHPTDIRAIRDRLLTHIDTLTENLPTDPRAAYHAALALDKFLAQLAELNRAIGTEPLPNTDNAPDDAPDDDAQSIVDEQPDEPDEPLITPAPTKPFSSRAFARKLDDLIAAAQQHDRETRQPPGGTGGGKTDTPVREGRK